MPSGVKRTLECLAASKNEAVVETLLAAVDHAAKPIRADAFQALLDRKCKAGNRGLIARWNGLDESERELLAAHSSRLEGELQSAINSADESLCQAAAATIIGTHNYDLFDALIEATETSGRAVVGQALLQLSDCLFEEISSPRDYSQRRDPQQVRRYVLASLESSVARFSEHGRTEPMEAFLALASRDNAIVRSALHAGRGELHRVFTRILCTSNRAGVVRMLLSALEEAHPPLALLRATGNRTDAPFLANLFERVSLDGTAACAANLAKIDTLRWAELSELEQHLRQWNGEEQQSAVRLIVGSGIRAESKQAALICVLQHGQPPARGQAMASLAGFHTGAMNDIVLAMIDDPDPEVQAAALVQLRQRKIPGAIATLIKRLESGQPAVSNAARSCLQEFTFARFLAAYEGMSADVRRSTGALVRKVDPRAIPLLVNEMRSPNRLGRMRAVEIAPLLGTDRRLQAALIACLDDSDAAVRANAAAQLSRFPGETSINALRQRLTDESRAVQETVERSLEILGGSTVTDEKSTIQWADLLEAGMRAKQ